MKKIAQDEGRRGPTEIGGRVYLSADIALTGAEEELKEHKEVILLKQKPYDSSLHSNTVIFMSLSAEDIFKLVTDILSKTKASEDFTISKESWKVTYPISKDQINVYGTMFKESAVIQIEILNAGDRGNAILIKRKAGSSDIFYQQFAFLKDAILIAVQ